MAAAATATAATSPHAAFKQQFANTFGPAAAASARVHIIRAPGRVNLIGEHTDYNDGFVCPMAIEPQVTVACRSREDGLVRLASSAFPRQRIEFSLQQKIGRIEDPRDPAAWSNYPRGVAAELIAAGIPLVGMDALFTHNLPVGGGLSSSAAMEISTGHCFLALAGLTMDPMRLALICQKAEHEYPRVPCGIMDQMIVASAQQGKATLFDCRELTKQYVSIDSQELRIVICNSMVKHALTGGEYAQRRKECETGVAYFQKSGAAAAVRALRDVTMQQLEAAAGKLDRAVLMRCRHVISENARCVEAAGALDHRHYEQAGELMIQSHRSLRDDYEVSCPELDFLADEAMKVKGVYGARMTGGGFGGCIVALCQPRAAEALTEHLRTTYKRKFNIDPSIFPTTATAGASLIE
jgi:galactokinase